jgi:hypothetical protein
VTGIPTAPPNAARVVYDATDNGDGTFTIHDVPICGELAAGSRGNIGAIGREWMESAVAAHMAERVMADRLAGTKSDPLVDRAIPLIAEKLG